MMLLNNSCIRVAFITALVFSFQSTQGFCETDPLVEGSTVVAASPSPVAPSVVIQNEKLAEPSPAPAAVLVIQESKSEVSPNPYLASELFLNFGLSANSYRLSGAGLATYVPFSPGLYFGFGYSTRQESGRGVLFQFSESINHHKNFTTVSPSVVELKQLRGEIMHRAPLSEKWSSLFGYGYFSRQATVTTPSQVIGEHRSHGPVLGLEFRRRQSSSDKWRLLSMAFLRLPVFFHERDSRSGAHVGSTEVEISLGMFYSLSRSIEIGVNPKFRGALHFYKGAGSRGVNDATERDLSFFFPVEVRMHF